MWFLITVTLTLGDYLTRGVAAVPGQVTNNGQKR